MISAFGYIITTDVNRYAKAMRYGLCILFFIICQTAQGQPTFSLEIDMGGWMDSNTGFASIGSSYFSFSSSLFRTGSSVTKRNHIIKYNRSGVIQKIDTLFNSVDTFFNAAWSSLSISKDSTLIVIGSFEALANPSEFKGYIVELDTNFNIIKRRFIEPEQELLAFRDLILYGDGFLLLATHSSSNVHLYHLDRDFNIVEEWNYHQPNSQTQRKIMMLPDSGFVVCGNFYVPLNLHAYVKCINKDFTIRWIRNLYGDNAWGTEPSSVGVFPNGDILFTTSLSKPAHFFYSKLARRYNSITGQLIWERQYLQEYNNAFTGNTIVLSEDEAYATGYRDLFEEGATQTTRYATITRLNGEGEVIWERLYYSHKGRGGRFYHLDTTSDGGLIAVGTLSPNIEHRQRGWIMKTDRDGCLVPGCDSLGMVTSTRALQEPLGELQAWPNPVEDLLYLGYSLVSPGTGYAIKVLDMSGRIVYSIPLSSYAPKGQIELGLQQLRPGMFIVQLWHNNTPQTTMKLVKSK